MLDHLEQQINAHSSQAYRDGTLFVRPAKDGTQNALIHVDDKCY